MPVVPPLYHFAVYPVGAEAFDPFLMDAPSLSGQGFAARRAWWSAFHLLGPKGIEPEGFRVNVWEGDHDGAEVGSGGIVDAAADLEAYLKVPR